MKAVCIHCGSAALSLNVEIEGSGWRHIDATYKPDGTLDVKEGHTERNYDSDETPDGYECADCGHTAGKIEDLVGPEGTAGKRCCCGHILADHPEQRKFDREVYTRGRRACGETGCGCWEFETDPVLATVVREAAAA